MFVFQRTVVNASGDVLTDARCEVRRAEDNVLADIFSDQAGTVPQSNPFFVDDEGFARFYAAAGLYSVRSFTDTFERTLVNVMLGVPLQELPNLTSIVQSIVNALLVSITNQINIAIAALPEIIKFTVMSNGAGVNLPTGIVPSRTAVGRYTVVHNRSISNYNVKLTVWDPGSDRLFSAMMISKGSDSFVYQVRSIFDEASNIDARVDIELTFE